jgi:hypothetical protein
MTVVATRVISKLTVKNFTPKKVVTDPADGTVQTAYTSFTYDFPNKPFRKVGDEWALAADASIAVKPIAHITIGADLTDKLLAHEQLHYDVGFVTARALAAELDAMRAATPKELAKQVGDAFDTHLTERAGAIQKGYDADTKHGVEANQQAQWLTNMRNCLANASATKLDTYDL